LKEEAFEIPGGENDIGVIGIHRLVGVEGVAWAQFETEEYPISGLELIGANETSRLSGFLLPHQPTNRFAFPLLIGEADTWSAVVVLAVGDPHLVTLKYLSDESSVIATETYWIEPGQKVTWVAPVGARHAVLTGSDLICFSLTGADDGRIAGYLGLAY
jgi:hypothetical protein